MGNVNLALNELFWLVRKQNPGALRASIVCPSEPEPAGQACIITGAADSMLTLEYVGLNQVDTLHGHRSIGAEKDVKFVHYKSTDCGPDQAIYTSVRPREADPAEDWEHYLPHQNRQG